MSKKATARKTAVKDKRRGARATPTPKKKQGKKTAWREDPGE